MMTGEQSGGKRQRGGQRLTWIRLVMKVGRLRRCAVEGGGIKETALGSLASGRRVEGEVG